MPEITCPNPECKSENVIFSKKKQIHICEDCKQEFHPEKPFIPLRVFISYGRDEYARLAERLKHDLKARGHEVWFDKDRLKEGADWEHYIDEGLNWVSKDPETGRVVFIMTPHSVRRPDGYCLNEIAKALTKSVPIVPVMLVYSEPPLSIYRLQYLDMQDCFPPDEKTVTYEKRLERLILALEEKKLDFEGAQSRLLKTLEPISFAADISKLLKDFTGRKWVFDQIDHWLGDLEGSKIFWLQGAPGIGKSAIAAWLRDNRREIAAFHFCDYRSEEKRNPCKLVRSIAYQLSTQLPAYEERLKGLGLEEIIQEYHEAYTLFDKLIVQPLAENFPIPDRTITILIDALDEATYQKRNEIALFLALCADKTPSWMRFLVTSRPEPEITSSLQSLSPCVLDTTTDENRLDLLEYLKKRLPQITNEQANILLARSEGVFLYASYVCDGVIIHKRLSLERLDEFPQGLGDVYFQFFDRQFGKDQSYYEKDIRPLLCAILASYEPLELGLLMDILGYKNRMELFDRLDRLGSLFPRTGGEDTDTISSFHRSLSEWITVKDKAGSYYIDVEYGHRLLADYGWRTYETGPESMMSYPLAWLPHHLVKINEYEKLVRLLKNFDYMMVKLKAGMLDRLLEDYRELPKAIPGEVRKELRYEEAFYRERAHILRRGNKEWPAYKILLQLAIEHADDSPLTQGAEKFLAEGKCDWVWLRRERRVAHVGVDPCIAVFEGHKGKINGAKVLADGRILSWSDDHTLRLWNRFGKPLAVLDGHIAPLFKAIVLNDGKILSLAMRDDRTLRLWNKDGNPLAILKGHTDEILNTIVLSNKRILSWSKDRTLRIWDEEGSELAILEGHKDAVSSAMELSDGRILSWSGDKTLRIWSSEGKPLVIMDGHKASVYGALILSNSQILSWSKDRTLRIWDEEGSELAILEGHKDAVSSAMELSDGRILSWSGDKTFRIWSSEGKPLVIMDGHKRLVYHVRKLTDGRILSFSVDGTLRLWDRDGNPLAVLDGHYFSLFENFGALELSGGCFLTWSAGKSLWLWDRKGKRLNTLEGHLDMIMGALVTTDWRVLSWSSDSTLRLWDDEGKPISVLMGHTKDVREVIAITDESVLSWSDDSTCRLWDIKVEALSPLDGHLDHVTDSFELSTGNILSWSNPFDRSRDRSIRLWSSEGIPLALLEGHTDNVRGVLELSNGHILSWAGDHYNINTRSSDHSLCLWSAEGKSLAVLDGHRGYIRGARELSDGSIASWSVDHTIRLWDRDGKHLSVLDGHKDTVDDVIELRNGHIVSWSFDQTIRLWDRNGKCLTELKNPVEWRLQKVMSLSGDHFFSWTDDGTLSLWNSDGTDQAVLKGHTDRVMNIVEFSDGRLLSCSADKTLRIWNREGKSLAVLEGHADSVYRGIILPSGCILSLARSGITNVWLWDSTGEPLIVYQKDEAVRVYPEARKDFLGKDRVASRSWLSQKRNNASLRIFGKMKDSDVVWHGTASCNAERLKTDGRAIVTQDNGQVCFLRTYYGNRRVSLEEVERLVAEMEGMELAEAIPTSLALQKERAYLLEPILPEKYSHYREKGTIAAIIEGNFPADEGLRWAIRKGYTEIISLALDKGADLCKEIADSVPAEYAQQKDKMDLIPSLIPDPLPQDAALQFRFARVQYFYHSKKENYDLLLKYCRDMESIALELQRKDGKIDHLMNAYGSMINSALVIGDFNLCAEYLAKSDSLNPEAQHYNHACLSASLGKIDEAFEWLEKHVNKEKDPHFEWMQKDPDLVSLRADPRWESKLDEWNQMKAKK